MSSTDCVGRLFPHREVNKTTTTTEKTDVFSVGVYTHGCVVSVYNYEIKTENGKMQAVFLAAKNNNKCKYNRFEDVLFLCYPFFFFLL